MLPVAAIQSFHSNASTLQEHIASFSMFNASSFSLSFSRCRFTSCTSSSHRREMRQRWRRESNAVVKEKRQNKKDFMEGKHRKEVWNDLEVFGSMMCCTSSSFTDFIRKDIRETEQPAWEETG